MNSIIYILIYLVGVLISSIAQLLLKKSSNTNYDSKIKEYLNFKTIFAYSIFFLATIFTVFSYKGISLSLGPILGSTEYIFIAILGYFFLNEKLSTRKIIGLFLVIVGVIVYFI